MRKEGLKQYLKKVSLAIGKSKYGVWTTIGHGAINTNSQDPSEFNIQLIAAPLVENTTLINHAEIFDLPVGAIELYQLRQSWSNKERSLSHYRQTPRTNLEFYIEPNEYIIRDLSDVYELSNTVSNSAISSLQGSKYLQYEFLYNDKKHPLFVPCAEVFRFYYSSSTNFAQQAFSSEKATECLYNPEKTYAKFREHFLTLRKYVRDVDAPFIGRIAFDNYARKCFEQIHSDTFHNGDNPEHYLICIPPIQELTRWKVNGIWKKNGFFVTHIVSCLAQFPFSNLIFNRDNNNQGQRDQVPIKVRTINKNRPVNKTIAGDDTSDTQQDPDPSEENPPLLGSFPPPLANVEPLLFESDVNNPVFEGLESSNIDKIKKLRLLDPETQTIINYTDVEVIEFLSTSKGSGIFNKGTFQLSVLRGTGDNINTTIESIYDVIPILNTKLISEYSDNLKEFEATYLNNNPHPYHPMATILPVSNDEITEELIFFSPQEYYQNNKDPFYLRPVALFVLTYKKTYYYLLEFLSKDGHTHDGLSTLLFSEFSQCFNDEFIEEQLTIFSKYRLSYKNEATKAEDASAQFAHRFTHPSDRSKEQKADLIFRILQSSFKSFK